MTDDRSPETASSPWRQPIIWLVIALVAASVTGGVIMVTVASRDGPVDAVAYQVQRTGQVQQSDLGPDARAGELGLSAVVRVDQEAGAVEVLPVTGRFERAAPLQLRLHHPLRAAEDRVLDLQPVATGWRAAATLDPGHDWLMQLGPADANWRLRGRLPRGQLAARVDPALDGGDPAPDAPAP